MKAKIIKSLLIHTLGISSVAAIVPMATACGEKKDDSIHVTGIRLLSPSGSVKITDNHIWLRYSVFPNDATNKEVTWESSDPTIATIVETKNAVGEVTPLKEGKNNSYCNH